MKIDVPLEVYGQFNDEGKFEVEVYSSDSDTKGDKEAVGNIETLLESYIDYFKIVNGEIVDPDDTLLNTLKIVHKDILKSLTLINDTMYGLENE